MHDAKFFWHKKWRCIKVSQKWPCKVVYIQVNSWIVGLWRCGGTSQTPKIIQRRAPFRDGDRSWTCGLSPQTKQLVKNKVTKALLSVCVEQSEDLCECPQTYVFCFFFFSVYSMWQTRVGGEDHRTCSCVYFSAGCLRLRSRPDSGGDNEKCQRRLWRHRESSRVRPVLVISSQLKSWRLSVTPQSLVPATTIQGQVGDRCTLAL